jgi:redox-sensitive bicupin YhaK (pirin superfamily)
MERSERQEKPVPANAIEDVPHRAITRVITGMPASDGAGVKLTRIVGSPECDHLDPFLLLDEFRNDNPDDYIAGFPAHPHRGFETVTYMLAGRVTHEDSVGNKGVLGPGAVQWMTAGRGIIHSEMPERTDGEMWGYQLWVNLPASLKMTPPRYQDIPSESIPVVAEDTGPVRVISGTYAGTAGAANSVTGVTYLDVSRNADAVFEHPLPDDANALIYVFEGGLAGPNTVGRKITVEAGRMALLSPQGPVKLTAGADGARFLFIAGQALGEPIARMGPFVMNTREELMTAADDYRRGKLALPADSAGA